MSNKQSEKQSKEQKDKKTEELKDKETKKESKINEKKEGNNPPASTAKRGELTPFVKGEGKASPEIKPGMTVRIHQKIKEKDKERIQIFEGIVIARKRRKEAGATITVRKISHGVGVEKIFPLFSPVIAKFEVVKQAKTRRAKLYFLRDYKKKLKEKKM